MVREHNTVEIVGTNYTREYAESVTAGLAAIGSTMGFNGVVRMTEQQIIEASGGELTITEARQLIQTAYNGFLWRENQIEIPKA